MNEIIVKGTLTLQEIASYPADFPAEVKAAGLETIKMLKQQLRDMEISISSNVISEMIQDNATKIVFINSRGEDKTLTLKSAPKKLNPNIKDFDEYLLTKGFRNLGEMKFVPLSWSACKELRKQGGPIQEVIDYIYVDGQQSVEIK